MRKFKYHVRIGSSLKQYSRIVYRTNSKQAAYRFGWQMVQKGDQTGNHVFPSIYVNGRFDATLVARGD